METSRRDNAMLMIQFAGYYQALRKLSEAWRTIRAVAVKMSNYDVPQEWGKKKIQALVRGAFVVYFEDLGYKDLTMKYLRIPEESEYPERAKAVEFLDSFFVYLEKIRGGKISSSDIANIPANEDPWKGLTDLMLEFLDLIDERVPPKEYVESIRTMRRLKDSKLG